MLNYVFKIFFSKLLHILIENLLITFNDFNGINRQIFLPDIKLICDLCNDSCIKIDWRCSNVDICVWKLIILSHVLICYLRLLSDWLTKGKFWTSVLKCNLLVFSLKKLLSRNLCILSILLSSLIITTNRNKYYFVQFIRSISNYRSAI